MHRISEISPVMESSTAIAGRHKVGQQAHKEHREIKSARKRISTFWVIVIGILFADYTMGVLIFDYLAPEIGGLRIGGFVLALFLPMSVMVMHLLAKQDTSGRFDKWLNIFAGIALFLFVLGAGLLIASIVAEGSFGLGTSDEFITGDIPESGSSTNAEGVYDNYIAGVPGLVFFFSISLVLVLSFFVSHRLLLRIEDLDEFLKKTPVRHPEIKAINRDLDAKCKAYELEYRKWTTAQKRLPVDVDAAFARQLSALVHKRLLRLQKAISQHKYGSIHSPDPLQRALGIGEDGIPNDIENLDHVAERIAAIRAAFSPEAIRAVLEPHTPHRTI